MLELTFPCCLRYRSSALLPRVDSMALASLGVAVAGGLRNQQAVAPRNDPEEPRLAAGVEEPRLHLEEGIPGGNQEAAAKYPRVEKIVSDHHNLLEIF